MIVSFLNKDYPYIPSKRPAWINNLLIGTFVAFFLIVFQPFDLSLWNTPYKTWKLIGFGFVSFLMPTLFSYLVFKLIPKKELEDKWKVWKEIALILGVLLSIALGNLLYGNLIRITDLSIKGFINSLMVTVLLGIFPISLAILNKYHRLLRLNLESAKQANEFIAHPHAQEAEKRESQKSTNSHVPLPQNKLLLIAENEKDKLEINMEDLLFIESQDNYSSIVFLEGLNVRKQLIRSSLKRLEAQIPSKMVKRCHRAFMVNLSKVAKVEGNAAGYILSFSESEAKVPVSRSYGPEVMSYFKTSL